MKTLITNAEIVNEGRRYGGSIVIEDGRIIEITDKPLQPDASVHETIDASGCLVMPGVIDSHVHFREPGLTAKADIATESRAAAAGGVTTYFDMPNTVPQTTTPEALEEKFGLAAEKSRVNYSFFFGATNDNLPLIDRLDATRIPGIKLFMGSSTGNMLVDRREALERIFGTVKMPVMAHCEDTAVINRNMEEARCSDPRFPDVALHPLIRSAEACYESTSLAVSLARRYGTRLHVAHLTTARELELFSPGDPKISAEATVGHLFFTDADYARLGARIKVNPAIKTAADRTALRKALLDGRITTVGTDHAPHLPGQKQGGCDTAASGMPMIQFSLVTMLELVDDGVLPVERMVELMCHAPARLFGVRDRGFLRPGCWADIVIVSPRGPWTVTPELVESRCGWSPMEGHTYRWRVERTLCNGQTVYDGRTVDDACRGMAVMFG
ncbi:MAG: dihydroorotase [Prevotella sp.]|nr:dihydroorotase [Prevotella sp.]